MSAETGALATPSKTEGTTTAAMQTPKYVIVSPVRDEEQHLERTIRSVLQQTILPSEWIIVDDGSHDRTSEIIRQYANEYSWIRGVHRSNRGQRVPGAGVMEAFNEGYRRLQIIDWQFIVKFDGDVELRPDYFERCFERLEANPKLGICGGVMYCYKKGQLELERHPMFHVRGPIKLYRRSCWESIGGLIATVGWDTIDELQANRLGWLTKSFSDLAVIHLRPTGAVQGSWRDGVKMGRAAYVCGYHPLFMLAKCAKRVFQSPYILGSLAHAYGFMSAYVTGLKQVEDTDLIRYTRQQQLYRLFGMRSIWK